MKKIFESSSFCNISITSIMFLFEGHQWFKGQVLNKLRVPFKILENYWIGYLNTCMWIQKQPLRDVPQKSCSENMQQICRRTSMPKCDFNKVAKQLYWDRTLAWVFSCKFAAYFQNTFSLEHLWVAASVNKSWFLIKQYIVQSNSSANKKR